MIREAMLGDLDIQRRDRYPEGREYRVRFRLEGENVTCIYPPGSFMYWRATRY